MPGWAREVAKKWEKKIVNHRRKDGWRESAPMMLADGDQAHKEALTRSNFKPSGGRSIARAADVMAGGQQPTRKALPQLLPDGMQPATHLQAALALKHPLAYKPEATDPVKYALRYAPEETDETRRRRGEVLTVLRELAAATAQENEMILKMVDPSVEAVLRAIGVKQVALMREISVACGSRCIASPALLLIGPPMLGWTPSAEGLLERVKVPATSVAAFIEGRSERNEKILRSIKASGDAKLDLETLEKTLAEVEKGVLKGPFESMQQLPFTEMALVPRHGIWEQHGEAVEQSCRCIDNMLKGAKTRRSERSRHTVQQIQTDWQPRYAW
jgi:hypothetical protein